MTELDVAVIEARNLLRKDKLGKNEVFIRVQHGDEFGKTKALEVSTEPIWNELFVFNHLRGDNILRIDVYRKQPIKNEKLGSLEINLRKLYIKGHLDEWFHIPSKSGLACIGQIRFMLSYKSNESKRD